MEFYVVDPKELDFSQWVEHIRAFCEEYGLPYTETEGGLYFLGDDIASPWHEDSVLFQIDGEDGGIIEVRASDENFYVFTDDLSHFDRREMREAMGYEASPPGVIYGFRSGNKKGCRFHHGPIDSISFLVREEEADYPPMLELPEVWRLFFRTVRFLQHNLSRVQDLRGRRAERVTFDFEVDLTFDHVASLDALSEILAEEQGYERHKSSLRATFRDRDIEFIEKFVSELPPEAEDFQAVLVRAVWRGQLDGEEYEIMHAGVERRQLRPFVQMPLHRSSKAMVDAMRTYLKGHRIDRQEYLADE